MKSKEMLEGEMEKLLEYLENCNAFEKNLNMEISYQYEKYLNIKKEFIEYLNKPQAELLDEIMKNFITIQLLAKYPRPKSNNEKINKMHYRRQKNYWLHQAFQKIKTKQGEIMTFYLRSNRFLEWCQTYDVCFRPWKNILEYVLKEYRNYKEKTPEEILEDFKKYSKVFGIKNKFVN